MRFPSLVLGFLLGAVLSIAASVVIAWTGPTSAPPNGNVAAPLNVGTTDQIKDAGLALNALAAFGNSILSGPSVTYLNFGDTSGSSGYGIRDNVGALEFKDSGGSWRQFLPSTGVQSITFADGTTQTTAGDGGGLAETTTVSCSGTGSSPKQCTTASCPAGYYRTGCSVAGADSFGRPTGATASPSGADACYCAIWSGSSLTCYTYCAK